MSFANVKEVTLKDAGYRIRQILAEKYIKYYILMNEDIFSAEEKNYYKQMTEKMKEEDISILKFMHKTAIKSESIEQFEKQIAGL